jgi:hypothetical protein
MMESSPASESPMLDHRKNDADLLLVEIAPFEAVDCVRVADGYLAGDIVVTGGLRECCPACQTEHLKLVLRQEHVKRAHMLCERCTRCFDARYPDGSPVFAFA